MSRHPRAMALLLILATAGATGAETPDPPESPLAFLEPFVGVWLPHPDWRSHRPNPRLHTLVPLNLQWRGGRTSLTIEEGLRDRSGYTTSGIVLWNPVTERADFLAQQAEDDLVFDGFYEPVDARTIRRIYDVIDRAGGVRRFRETMHLRQDGGMDWTTEQEVDGEYRHVRGGSGPEFHAVRPGAEPETTLDDFAVLVGEWRPDPSRMPAEMVAWRKRHEVSDGYASFSWGTERRWMAFGEHRQQAGTWRLEGSGLIALDPASRMVVYREHTDRGITLEGSLERIDPLTIKRHYRAARPDGTVVAWEDTWRWQAGKPDCFEWTTARVAGRSLDARPPYWVCRRPTEPAAPESDRGSGSAPSPGGRSRLP